MHEKLLGLPDAMEIFPAHFAGSACGAGMSGKPSSTLAFEKSWNPMLSLDRDAFVRTMSEKMLAPPNGMDQILAANRGQV